LSILKNYKTFKLALGSEKISLQCYFSIHFTLMCNPTTSPSKENTYTYLALDSAMQTISPAGSIKKLLTLKFLVILRPLAT
jgi:hypothetical protein